MEANWYYSENGQALGPMSANEIADRIRQAENEPHFVWIEGMSDWTDASTVPEFAAAFRRRERRMRPAPRLGRGREAHRPRSEPASRNARGANFTNFSSFPPISTSASRP